MASAPAVTPEPKKTLAASGIEGLDNVLGGGFYATRLYRDLREKTGLVYTVSNRLDAGRTRAAFSMKKNEMINGIITNICNCCASCSELTIAPSAAHIEL